MSLLAPERARRDGLRVRQLTDVDRAALIELVERDSIVNVVLAARLAARGSLAPAVLGGAVLGAWQHDRGLVGAAFHGGNLMPVGGDAPAWAALAEALGATRRGCTSIVGPADAVHALWPALKPSWGRARAVRERQLLLRLDREDPLPTGDPRVRTVNPVEVDAYLPAASSMFTEELGVSPLSQGAPGDYRRRVMSLLRDGHGLAVVEDGVVVFKADLGAVSAATCQVQGVWVRPDRRGEGIATGAMAAVLRHALTLAPTVSLYVNDFNTPARRLYERLGMHHEADLATVLF